MGKDTIYIDFNRVKDWFKDFFIKVKIFFDLSYRFMNYEYSKEWDLELNRLMKEHNFVRESNFKVRLGDTDIWVANHP